MKWYFGTLIVILAFFGFTQEQKVSPNQEIVIQFNDNEVTAVDAKGAIAIVKKQLQDIGINSFEVKALQDGQLKIAYYSVTDAASVKNILSNENKIGFDYSSISIDGDHPEFPLENQTNTFNLDVYKIQDSQDTNSGFDGSLAIELKPEIDRFFNPIVDFFAVEIDNRKRDRIIKVTYKLNRNIAIAIDNSSHNIPEVRAGPQSTENS